MGNIASLLRQERERQGLSLQEVERQTHVPLRYLDLLEGKGDKWLLADPLYLLPLLRTYADFLGMNSVRVMTDFTLETQESQQQMLRRASVNRGQEVLSPPSQRSRTFSLTVVLVVTLATLAVIGQLSTLSLRQSETRVTEIPSSSSSPAPLSTVSPASPPVSSASPPSPPSGLPLVPGPETTSSAPPTATLLSERPSPSQLPDVATPQAEPSQKEYLPQQAFAAEGTHVLHIEAKEPTWIRVTITGQPPRDMILQPGQTVEWTSPADFLLTLGNAGGVSLTVDGQLVPPLGKSGQVVRNIRLPVQG